MAEGTELSDEPMIHQDTFDFNAYTLVAAIDLGTSFSGYAYAFKNKPKEIIINRNWGDELGASSLKAPTSVLINDQGHFVSFGYKAEHEYAEHCIHDKGKEYQLYRHFKMLLYQTKDINNQTMVKSVCGMEHNAVQIFAHAVCFMKDDLLNSISRKTQHPVENKDILWVLTIPAIWSEQAKHFMREVAFQAGLTSTKNSCQLVLSLEPEAASVCCRNLEANHFTEVPKDMMEVVFPKKTKYMIIDAGGGTVDITAHEIIDNGNLIELMCATGGEWGGNQVDQHFKEFLCELLGFHFIEVYMRDFPHQWLNFMTDFEKKKRAVNIVISNTGMSLPLPWSMSGKYMEVTGMYIERAISEASAKGVPASFKDGYLIIEPHKVQSFFAPVLDNIVNQVKEIIETYKLSDLNSILLVGGFSDSMYVFHRMKSEFSDLCPVLCPYSASMAVLKGAVMFGSVPYIIEARRARKTYGVCSALPFVHGKHNPKKFFLNEEGHSRCRDLFQVFVTKEELSSEEQPRIEFYTTEANDVVYVDEPGVSKVGEVKINMPLIPGLFKRERIIEKRIYFGSTQIKIEIEDKSRSDGDVVTTHIDFTQHC